MSNFISQDKVVNANDNLNYHWLEIVEDDKKDAFIKNIPTANYIIEKHGKEWWRNKPFSHEYRKTQLHMCYVLTHAKVYEEYVYHYLAMSFCSPLSLKNDPNLAFILQT